MKNAVLSLLLLAFILSSNAQNLHKVSYVKWSNPMTFKTSPSPVITGNGELSDSLLSVFDVQSVYEYNDEYFLINSWADYYEWYTTRFWFQFDMPELYHYYYNANDDYGMANFILSNFKGRYYPSNIMITCNNNEPLMCWSPKKIPSKNKEKVIRYRNRIEKQEKMEIRAQSRRLQEVKMINAEAMYPVNGRNSYATTVTSNLKSSDSPRAGALQQDSRRGTSETGQLRGSLKSSVAARTGANPSLNRRSSISSSDAGMPSGGRASTSSGSSSGSSSRTTLKQ